MNMPTLRRFSPFKGAWPKPEIVLATVVLFLGGGLARAEVKAGDIFPVLGATGLEGAVPETRGKVVLVDFWASWCAPCKASFPIYAKIDADYRARGLVVFAVSVDEKDSAYQSFVKKLAPPFAVARDGGQKLVREVSVPTMPTSYLIDRTGRVRFVHPGFHGAETEAEVRKEIATLLAEPASP